MDKIILSTAVISNDGLYRYRLERIWDDSKPSLVIVMLNPSTADASINDPTIRRCIAFAMRDGYGGICVVNLFAFRATKPSDLKKEYNPFGPKNNDYIETAVKYSVDNDSKVLCAWGSHGSLLGGDAIAINIMMGLRAEMVCLGKTSKGQPKHPLYVHGHMPMEVFP